MFHVGTGRAGSKFLALDICDESMRSLMKLLSDCHNAQRSFIVTRPLKKAASHAKGTLNVRLDPRIKDRVARAAALTGQEVTDFVVSVISARAEEIIDHHSIMVLNDEDYHFFLNVLSEDRKPSRRSRAAAKRYRQRLPRGR
jgi:uncharacterized protein (DUF1778 family)